MIARRDFLGASAKSIALALVGIAGSPLLAAAGSPKPFDFSVLRERARELHKKSYQPRPTPAAETVKNLGFETVQKINFDPDRSLWKGNDHTYPVRFFHLHQYAPSPIKIHVVENGEAREVSYAENMFDYGDTKLAEKLPEDIGFAGFRVLDGQDKETDWLAFQSASYFRASGAEGQYGLSARGIALNTALETREEFPSFTEFWLEDRTSTDDTVRVYALLDGPSITGAYQFDVSRNEGVVMDILTEIFLRDDIERLGMAPLTSMYWYGENSQRVTSDWRPEVHDNDGLAMWTGEGERIFRPLTNPPVVEVSTFVDKNPRGFGLIQRDRDFENYQDDGAFYDKRPSVWIEPLDGWGDGAVQLVEIPTNDEIHDNIVAFWRPKSGIEAGQHLAFKYRLHWKNRQPYRPESVSEVVATRIGRAGVPGEERPPMSGNRKFVLDFRGGPLSDMEARFDIDPVITVSRGEIKNPYVVKVVGTDRWRAVFDLSYEDVEPLDLRCFLRLDRKTLSETWLYKFFPETE